MRLKTYLIIYGGGGHQEEMRRLLNYGLFKQTDNVQLLAISDSDTPIVENIVHTFKVTEFRDKHSYCLTLLKLPWNVIKLTYLSLILMHKHDLKGCITTGPGLAIIPFVIFRLFSIKTIAIETWAMFYSPSKTGKLLYRIAETFLIQNECLRKVYPKALFYGRL